MYAEDEFLQLSALQHYLFCPRQCALIHIEQAWEENILTAEGRVMHESAHEEKFEARKGVKIERGMPLRSKELGLNGKVDVVEFHRSADGKQWLPFPVEYKRGKPKFNDCDRVQLCAQALCLEEMLGICIFRGALFYGKIRHRVDVEFDDLLRQRTKNATGELHKFLLEGKTPRPVYAEKCKSCSLISLCMPKVMASSVPVAEYLRKEVEDA